MNDIPDDDTADYDGTCQRCWGDGGYHDCGEDTCCCDLLTLQAMDNDDDWVVCETCGGTGISQ